MIYCDYGALSNENRKLLMSNVYDRLKPGGRFLLDVCSIKQYVDLEENQTWEIQEQDGFWSPEKCLCFNANCKYQDYTTLTQREYKKPKERGNKISRFLFKEM